MRRIENEHGCTPSRREEKNTNGKSQTPPSLIFQIMDEAAELFLSKTIPTMIAVIIPKMIVALFILLRCYYRLYLNLDSITGGINQIDETVYGPDSGRAMRRRAIHDLYATRFSCFDNFV